MHTDHSHAVRNVVLGLHWHVHSYTRYECNSWQFYIVLAVFKQIMAADLSANPDIYIDWLTCTSSLRSNNKQFSGSKGPLQDQEQRRIAITVSSESHALQVAGVNFGP